AAPAVPARHEAPGGEVCAAESPAAGTSADIGAPASGPGSVARSRHSASSHPTACRSSQGHEGSGGEPGPPLAIAPHSGAGDARSVALRPTRPDLFPQSVEPNIPPIEERLPAADSPPGKSSLGPPAAPHGAGDRSAILPNGESRLAIPERLSRHQQPEVVSWLHETTILHNAQLLMTLRLVEAKHQLQLRRVLGRWARSELIA